MSRLLDSKCQLDLELPVSSSALYLRSIAQIWPEDLPLSFSHSGYPCVDIDSIKWAPGVKSPAETLDRPLNEVQVESAPAEQTDLDWEKTQPRVSYLKDYLKILAAADDPCGVEKKLSSLPRKIRSSFGTMALGESAPELAVRLLHLQNSLDSQQFDLHRQQSLVALAICNPLTIPRYSTS